MVNIKQTSFLMKTGSELTSGLCLNNTGGVTSTWIQQEENSRLNSTVEMLAQHESQRGENHDGGAHRSHGDEPSNQTEPELRCSTGAALSLPRSLYEVGSGALED